MPSKSCWIRGCIWRASGGHLEDIATKPEYMNSTHPCLACKFFVFYQCQVLHSYIWSLFTCCAFTAPKEPPHEQIHLCPNENTILERILYKHTCTYSYRFLLPHSADQFYPFGDHVGDKELVTGIAKLRNTSSKVTLTPAFRFFSNVEDTLWVSMV